MSDLPPSVVALIHLQRNLTYLRADEGDSVTLLCDNPDPASPDQNNAIECNGDWTDWKDRRFQGESLDAAVRAAVEAKRAAEARPGVVRLSPETIADIDRVARLQAAEVVGYCWEVQVDHPRIPGRRLSQGGADVYPGQRGPVFEFPPVFPQRPWGLTQIWIMRNGQEVRATWKVRA